MRNPIKVLREHWRTVSLVLLATIALVVGLRWLLGGSDWAGLGQWVGGLGAFYAALVALNISNREARHREETEAEQARVRANLVTVTVINTDKLHFRNRGTTPVMQVAAIAFHRNRTGEAPENIPLALDVVQLLMPEPSDGEGVVRWFPAGDPMWTNATLNTEPNAGVFEFHYTDVQGTRWSRRGHLPPEPIGKA